jgi:hypothetical protein
VVGLSECKKIIHKFIKKRLFAFKGNTQKAERDGDSVVDCICGR